MSLPSGARLGPYEVIAAIGQGGMGEVYRAKDTKLGRDVALKILPDAFAHDPDRLARFEREAQLLACLSHPNIAQIYGLETGPAEAGLYAPALVLELIEGPTLADRIAEGAIPVDEALQIAGQIAAALEAAHDAGVIHRDLKPANIKLRSDGTVKVLDFGLAKAIDASPGGSSSLSMSPTITTPAMTQAGLILGTAAYMSPEQARGKPVDKRADIWAFGAVLFEMLTGRRAFAGDEVSDVLASVLAREPQLRDIPRNVPESVRQVLKACLQKDPKQRLHDMADVRLVMAGTFETATDGASAVSATASSAWKLLPLAIAVVVAAGSAAAATWMLKPAEPRAVMRFSHRLDEESFTRTGRPVVAVSRDGRRLAYVANSELYLRNLDDPDARPIPGTSENPSSPFFSADGEWVGFWSTNEELKKIRLAGGTPVTLTKAGNPLGISWSADDTIVYALNDGIWRVSANGGVPERIVKAADGERVHAPQMLPGGNAVLFTVTTVPGADGWDKGDIVVQALDTGERKVVHSGGAYPRYLSTGHLLYTLGNTLFALPFDLGTREVRGGPVPLVPEVRRAVGADIGIAQYAASEGGTLVYVSGGSEVLVDLALVDRSGKPRVLPNSSASFFHPRLSPDDSRIAVQRDEGGDTNIWIYEVSQSQWRQLTFEGGDRPVWTPDGRAITFRRDSALWQIPADFGGAAEQLPETDVPGNLGPFSWSPKGDVLLYGSAAGLREYRASGKTAASDTMVLAPPPGANGIPRASFSSDGRWVVYTTGSAAGSFAYVSPFPFGPGGHRKVTNDQAFSPVWSHDGREIFVVGQPSLQVIQVMTEPALTWTNPATLFTFTGFSAPPAGSTNYDVTRDGRQFAMVVPVGTATSDARATPEIRIVLNWTEELKRLVPANSR